jgi:hypothetical protein
MSLLHGAAAAAAAAATTTTTKTTTTTVSPGTENQYLSDRTQVKVK